MKIAPKSGQLWRYSSITALASVALVRCGPEVRNQTWCKQHSGHLEVFLRARLATHSCLGLICSNTNLRVAMRSHKTLWHTVFKNQFLETQRNERLNYEYISCSCLHLSLPWLLMTYLVSKLIQRWFDSHFLFNGNTLIVKLCFLVLFVKKAQLQRL